MKLSSREIALAGVTLILTLFGATYVVCRPAIADLQNEVAKRSRVQARLIEARHLAAQVPTYEARLTALTATLPKHPMKKDVTQDLMRRLDALSKQHGLQVIRRTAENEEQLGELYELTIKWDWQAELEPIVRVLYSLQQENVMIDVLDLVIRPKAGRLLQGRFTVAYAFSRTNDTTTADLTPNPGGHNP